MPRLRGPIRIYAIMVLVAAVAVSAEIFVQHAKRERRQADLAKLAQRRCVSALNAYKETVNRFQAGEETYHAVYAFSVRLLSAELDRSPSKEARIRAYKAHYERLAAATSREACLMDYIRDYLDEARFWIAKEENGMDARS